MGKPNKILLVEPNYKSLYPPLGLMKISTWHKNKGHIVNFVKGKIFSKIKYDYIYITTLFTYYAKEVVETIDFYKTIYPSAKIEVGGILASLLPEYIKENTKIIPHVGLFESVEYCSPDYSLFPDYKYSISFTTRGCFRKCKYCAVKKHEPKYLVKKNWERDINENSKGIIFWDNNWLCSPNFYEDIEKLKNINKLFDFNQGLDAKLFTNEKARPLSKLKIRPLRFSFDSIKDDGYVQKAIQIAKKNNMNDIRVYVLYNFNDSPQDFYYRIKEVNKLGALSYPMRYRAINSVENHYISENWDYRLLRALKLILMFYYSKGMIRRNHVAFKNIFGNSEKIFVNKLYEIFEKDKKKSRKDYNLKFEIPNIEWEKAHSFMMSKK